MLNNVILMGRLTRDVELRYAQGSDRAVGRFSLAVERDYKAEGRDRETDFINCVAFEKTAEFIDKYFKKGSMIAIVGKIQTGSYTNRDGVKVYTTEVIVTNVSFTGESKQQTQQQAAPQPQYASQADTGFMNIPDGIDEELPFL